MPKHDWNDLQNYLDVHERVLRFYSVYMTPVRTYSSVFLNPQRDYFDLELNNVQFKTVRGTIAGISIEKNVLVDWNFKRPKAKTWGYKYHAYDLSTGGGLLRYCSPDLNYGAVGAHKGSGHHAGHHKHDFKRPGCDPLVGDISAVGADEWPHVGEFFNELLMCY